MDPHPSESLSLGFLTGSTAHHALHTRSLFISPNLVEGQACVRSKFLWGAGVVDGVGSNSERCLKWDDGR